MHFSKRKTVWKLSILSLCMFAFGFALVPLYDVMCEITGLNGRTGILTSDDLSAQTQENLQPRTVRVEFLGLTESGLPWNFAPQDASLDITVGTASTTFFSAKNFSDVPMVGKAVPSVSPVRAATHLKKIECFCFEQQELNGGGESSLPVRFVVDSKLPEDISVITLAYTMFDVTPSLAGQD